MSDPFTDLKAWLTSGPSPACIGVFSPERTRRTRAVKFLLDELSKKTKFQTEHIDAGELSLDKLRLLEANFKTLSLFAESKVYHFHSIGGLKKELLPFVEQIIASNNQQNVVIFSDAPLAKKLPSSALFTKKVPTVVFPILEGTELQDWIQREAKRSQLSPIPEPVMRELTQLGEEGLDEIAARIEKLALFADSPSVDLATYQQLFPLRVFGNDYKLIETLVAGDRRQAEYLTNLSIQEGSQALGLMALLSKTTAQVSQIALGAPSKNSAPPWVLQKYKRLAQNLNFQKVSRAFISLSTADFRLKDKNLGAEHVLSKVAQLFAHK